jgi:NAD(P)-dependent dehydrogenase (short-subunit alcohol dehydrogenase family)
MKKILITGCSSGFGFDASQHLAQKGHHVFATMRNVNGKNAEAAAALRDYASANALKLEVLEMDVSSDQSVEAAAKQLPTIDVLINNAGMGFMGPLEAFNSKQILDQLDLNIVGTVRAGNAVLPGMRAQKSGLIIQVSSVMGRTGTPSGAVYSASKWGLEGLSESWRYELAPLGIDVVIVEPGPFATNFLGNVIGSAKVEVLKGYGHLKEFNEGLVTQIQQMYDDPSLPTDPMIVVQDFEKLIDMEPGTRPMRTISGLDWGVQLINDATEPLRKAGLEGMNMANLDGPH